MGRAKKDAIRDRDQWNRDRYGEAAPLHCERIWIDPAGCTEAISLPWSVGGAARGRLESGTVVEDPFPPHQGKVMAVSEVKKIGSCLQRWVHGAEWEETEMYLSIMTKVLEARAAGRDHKGLKTSEDVLRKCREYDQIYAQVRAEGRLRTRQELKPGNFREKGAVVVHLGPGGRLYHGKAGNRRFAIALALKLPIIPAMIGYVHRGALDLLPALRTPPPEFAPPST